MKVLHKDKIVETFRFPFSEALSFSILLWTIWGFTEAFFWEKVVPFFDPGAIRIHHFIYIPSFLLYAGIATITASLMYGLSKWILFTLDRHETPKFRSATLCLILGAFFVPAIAFVFQNHLSRSLVPRLWLWLLLAATIAIAAVCLILLYRSAANEGFRIRRSGTTMMSILVLNMLLSFVNFPIFSSGNSPEPAALSLKASLFKLMALHYMVDTVPSAPQK